MAPVSVADPDHAALYQALNSIVDKMDEIAKDEPFALGGKARYSDAGAELRSLADLVEHRLNMLACGAGIDRDYFPKEAVAAPLEKKIDHARSKLIAVHDHLNLTRDLQAALGYSCGNSFSTPDANSTLAASIEKRLDKLSKRIGRLREELA